MFEQEEQQDELLEKIEHIDMSERIRWDNIL